MTTQALLVEGVKEIIQDTTFTSARILDYLNQGVRQIAGGLFIQYPDRTQVFTSPLPELLTDSDLTTSTTNPYVDLPSDYGRNLIALVSATNDIRIEVMGSLAELLNYYPELDKTYRVTGAAIRGKRLYYQGMPSTAETLTAYYSRLPYDMKSYTAGTISFDATAGTIADSASGFGDFHIGQTIDITGTTNNNISVVPTAATSALLTVAESLTDESAGSDFTLKSRPDAIPIFLQESLLENFAAWQIFQRKVKNDIPMEAEAKRYHGLFIGAMLSLESSIENLPEPIRLMNDTGY
jgi:hypothetical protein